MIITHPIVVIPITSIQENTYPMIADKKIDRNKLPYPVKKDRQPDNQEEYDDTRPISSKDYSEQHMYVVRKPRYKRIVYVVQDLPLY